MSREFVIERKEKLSLGVYLSCEWFLYCFDVLLCVQDQSNGSQMLMQIKNYLFLWSTMIFI